MWKLLIPIGQILQLGPGGRGGRAQNVKDFEELVNFRVAGEKRLIGQHLVENAAKWPHIGATCVALWSSINFEKNQSW